MAEGGNATNNSGLNSMSKLAVTDLNQATGNTRRPNELGGVILAGASWLAGDEKTKLAKKAFGKDVTNTAIGGQKTSDVLNQLNVFERDGGTFAPNTTVVLDIGANDIATGVDEGTIRNNLNEIVSRLGASGVNVILSGQPEAHSYEEAIARTDLKMDDLYSEIAENNPNVTLVDAMSGMLNQKDLMDESRFHLKDDDAKLEYLSKFADAYKGTETTNQDVVETSNVGGLTQVSQPELDQSPPIMSDNIPAEIVTDKAENDSDVAEAIAQLGDNQQDFEIAEAGDNMDDYQPSAGYTYAQNNSSIDNYYQVINDFLSQDRSQDEIQAAMQQYGVSQSDIDAARSMQPQSEMGRAKGGAIRLQVGGLSALAKLGTAGTKLTKAEIA